MDLGDPGELAAVDNICVTGTLASPEFALEDLIAHLDGLAIGHVVKQVLLRNVMNALSHVVAGEGEGFLESSEAGPGGPWGEVLPAVSPHWHAVQPDAQSRFFRLRRSN